MTAPRIRTLMAVLATFALTTTVGATAVARPAARALPTRDTKIVKGVVTSWSPSTIRISDGDTIKWKSVSGTHTVTAYGGNWNYNHALNQGSTVARKFTQTGTFKFRCTFHSSLVGNSCTGMCGKVVVSA
jgi:plastocyanin